MREHSIQLVFTLQGLISLGTLLAQEQEGECLLLLPMLEIFSTFRREIGAGMVRPFSASLRYVSSNQDLQGLMVK
jgi:hypothetical protein